jgi:cytochrome c-type biogenesis protein CcmH/NrfG
LTRESIAVGIAGVFFGVLIGWILGIQQSATPAPPAAAAAASAPSGPAASAGAQPPAPLDDARAAALKATADQHPADETPRLQLANLYFDAERFQEAVEWYGAALKINPKDVNASTDLGISLYYMNQPDRALAQFDHSLSIDPAHAKTLFNVGVVRAFGKQDLKGASEAWQQVLQVAPNSDEARDARQALDGMKAHQSLGADTPKTPGAGD